MEFWWHSEGKAFEILRSGDSEPCSWICPDGHVTNSNCTTKVGFGRAVCAYCNGNRPVVGLNDLATTDPTIAAFWHPTKNAPRELCTVSVGSAFEAWWLCDEGHEFPKPIIDFKLHPGCPECRDPHRLRAAIDLRQKYPHFAQQWDPERNSTPEPPAKIVEWHDIVWWTCQEGHHFSSTVADRQRRDGNCPACTSRRVLPGATDLGTVYPAIAAELHPTLNGELRAENLLPQAQGKVWWLCPNGHDYRCVVAVRTKLGIGCTKCTGRSIVAGITDFASVKPKVAARWHPTMNGERTAADVHPGSAQQAWFTCPCGKPYQTEIRMMRPDRYCREYTDYLRWHVGFRCEDVGASL
ncbi:zinc-ribbon domain-containing protein [Cryobacterium sp. MP_3.1]|uniref:zinc-ribbon domain-containing protein n=1 Tax=Cryobacterium sp. MP_3.1 TaxID=3071711 RepID=UPI003FA34441